MPEVAAVSVSPTFAVPPTVGWPVAAVLSTDRDKSIMSPSDQDRAALGHAKNGGSEEVTEPKRPNSYSPTPSIQVSDSPSVGNGLSWRSKNPVLTFTLISLTV